MKEPEKMGTAISRLKISDQLPKKSQTIPILFKEKENNFEVSIYKGELTKEGVLNSFVRIKAAFPKLDSVYFDILKEMLKDDNFVDDRLKDAVKHVIKTCVYPEPTIANFLSYDKNIKVYDYNQYLKLVDELGTKTGQLYQSVRFPNAKKPAWVHVNDIEKYKLKLWINQKS